MKLDVVRGTIKIREADWPEINFKIGSSELVNWRISASAPSLYPLLPLSIALIMLNVIVCESSSSSCS